MTHDRNHLKPVLRYTVGFVLSLLATMLAFWLVATHQASDHEFLSHRTIQVSIVVLALLQLLVQIVFFLHLGREQKPRWNTVAFLFMLETVAILVLGTLWIMANLNYNMMPQNYDEQIRKEELIDTQ